MKIVIIGGGASGMALAASLSDTNLDVTLVEKNNKNGKKLLLTGNGRANYFNDDFKACHYHSAHHQLLEQIITDKNKEKVLSFFSQIGVVPKITNGYYYPFSNQAVTLHTSLLKKIEKGNIHVENDTEVTKVEYHDKFYLTTSKGIKEADILVLALGSKAYPNTGSTGMGYQLATSFNHHLITPLPALTGLHIEENYGKDWAGVRCDVKLTLYIDEEKVREEMGEIQLTDYGISGICVFNLSSLAIRTLSLDKKVQIKINFLPYLKEDIMTYMTKREETLPNYSLNELFDGMLNYKITNMLFKKHHIKNDVKTLSLLDKEKLFNDFVELPVTINGYNDFMNAQVCSGGIPLDEIDINTFASLKQKNLYIIGETLDVDGDCGGYNLGFAWLSALLASDDIRGKYDKN